MIASGSRRPWTLLAALLLFIAGFGTTVGVGVAWQRDLAGPRFTALGSGDRVSLLATDGPARVLVVDGDNPADFANAVASALHPGLGRIDLLVLTADPLSDPVAARAVQVVDAKRVVIARPGNDARFLVGGITVEVVAVGDPNPGWRAVVSVRGQRMVLGSAPRMLTGPEDVAGAVVPGDDLWDAAAGAAYGLLVASAWEVNGDDARLFLASRDGQGRAVVRVFPGEAVRIEASEDGLTIPASTAVEPAP